MTNNEKICLIHSFRNMVIENSGKLIVPEYKIPDSFEIDLFVLKDICHLLNQYEREIFNNAKQ